jgi:ribonuclease VapC
VIIDTSAILAILFAEPEADHFSAAILAAETPRMSVASYLEASLRLAGRGAPALDAQLDVLLEQLGVILEPVTVAQGHAAREAGARFGKGRHPAGLNYGDCFSYALAKTSGARMLFKGDDFSRTDTLAAT